MEARVLSDAPTADEIWSAVAVREVGGRPAPGPIANLGRGRWSVPVCGYMDHAPMGEVVIHRTPKKWIAERAPRRPAQDGADFDPVARVRTA